MPAAQPSSQALAQDALILKVAYAYDALPFDTFQRLQSALAGDHNIAQALDTAREIVATLNGDELALVLARLLVTTDDAIGTLPAVLMHPGNSGHHATHAAAHPMRRRSDQAGN